MLQHKMSIHLNVEDFDPDSIQLAGKQTLFLEFNTILGGEVLGIPVMLINGRQKGRTLVAIAGIHGDEYEGVQALHEVFHRVNADELTGRFIAVPIANLPAHRACTRKTPIDGLNLARVFPGRRDGTITERLAHFLLKSIISRADFFIDLHSAGIDYLIPPLVGYEISETDHGRTSQEAAFIFGTPVVWGHPGEPPPGRTISEAHRLGIPWLYVEASGGGRIRTDELSYYTDGLLNLLKFRGMIPGSIDAKAIKFHLVGNGDIDNALAAGKAGFFVPMVRTLEHVSQNQIVGVVRDIFGDTIEEVKASKNGYVVLLRALPIVYPGDTVCVVTSGT
jgi:predicted deacylase